MTKICRGCGIPLQNINSNELGYVKSLSMDYCMRCFRIQNYGDYQNAYVEKDAIKILKKLNTKKGMVFFFVDFLNLHEESISYFKQIFLPKVFVVSKMDLIPKNISFEKIRGWLKDVYGIEEPILFTEKNSKSSVKKIEEWMREKNYFVGLTNAGKSSILNQMLENTVLTVSKMPNTTLEFLPIHWNDKMIYDTPGLSYHYVKELVMKSNALTRIKPITYPLKSIASLVVERFFRISSDTDVSMTYFESSNLKIEKIYEKNTILMEKTKIELDINPESLLFIKGVCFFYIKGKCRLTLYGLQKEEIALSKSFLGGCKNE